MRFKVMPRWFKQTIAIAGLLLALPGIVIGLGLLCLAFILIIDNDTGAVYAGLVGFTLIMLTAGTGGATFWHSIASLNGKMSNSLRLPPLWGLVGILALYFIIGMFIYQSDFVTGLFLPPMLLMTVSVPPLIAIAWFTGGQMKGLTWRRGTIAFAGAATFSLVIFLIVQFVILITISLLNTNPAEVMIDTLELGFEGLFERNGISGTLGLHFTSIFVQLTIVFPFIGAMAKPLITIPLLGQVSRRDAFLLGAIAGAGFAALESLIFVGFGFPVWTWILIVQSLGAAIHPLGSGLAALGLWEVVRGRPNAWSKWLAFFAIATALHSLWNLGFLLIISRHSLFFLVRGITIVPVLLALIGLAIGTPWAGRSIGQQLSQTSDVLGHESVANRLTLLDQGLVVWALASLIMILPAGIIGLQYLLR